MTGVYRVVTPWKYPRQMKDNEAVKREPKMGRDVYSTDGEMDKQTGKEGALALTSFLTPGPKEGHVMDFPFVNGDQWTTYQGVSQMFGVPGRGHVILLTTLTWAGRQTFGNLQNDVQIWLLAGRMGDGPKFEARESPRGTTLNRGHRRLLKLELGENFPNFLPTCVSHDNVEVQ
jgi:hypothetical protein